MNAIRIKRWFKEKIESESRRYHIVIETKHPGWGEPEIVDENGCVITSGEVLKETEKAMQIKFDAVKLNKDMTCTTWTAWVPKSVIA